MRSSWRWSKALRHRTNGGESDAGRSYAAVTTLGIVALATPAHAGAGASVKEWADGVCSAVLTFGESVDATLTSLNGSTSLDEASQTAKSGLDDAVESLEASLEELGRPPSSDGKKARAAVQDLADELNNAVTSVESLLSPPPETPQAIASTFSQIGSEVQKAAAEVQASAETLKGLKPNGALQKAFQSAPACKQLETSR